MQKVNVEKFMGHAEYRVHVLQFTLDANCNYMNFDAEVQYIKNIKFNKYLRASLRVFQVHYIKNDTFLL